jgi:carboxylesterase type B
MFLQVMSDMSFGINHERTLDAHLGPAYAYRFDYESPIKTWTDGEPLPTPLGACHALGVMFMWGNHRANEYLAEFCGDDATADGLAELMMDSWVSFAATGCPETDGTGVWSLHDPMSREVMVFGDGNVAMSTLRQNPRAAELAAWGGFRRLPAGAKM